MNNSTLNFVTRLLKSTTKLDLHYLKAPYSDLAVFDRSLRDSLQTSEALYGQIYEYLKELDHNTFSILTDCYELNYIFFYPYENRSDLITIGPYLIREITEEYWSDMINRHKLSVSNVQNLKGFLFNVPTIDNNLFIISVVGDIIQYINPSATPFTVSYRDFNDADGFASAYQPKYEFDAYSKLVEKRYDTEQQLLRFISMGNAKGALDEAKKFVSALYEPRIKNSLREHKSSLITANTLFRKSVEVNEIHPIHLHEISSKFVNKIENTTTIAALNQLYEKMIRDYCHLVQVKSTRQYSPLVRKILNHIEFNLDAKITLQELADENSVSVPHLSNQFKKEVGVTVIKHINHLRIVEAAKLLHNSSITIQDVASCIGIYDYNYFTKVFKKETGKTPTEYRKSIFSSSASEE